MKFTIERDALARAVAAASRAVSRKSTIDYLEGICLEAQAETVRLTGYNLEVGIAADAEASVRETGACILPTQMFADIVRKLQENVVNVEMDGGCRVTVRSGGATFRFQALDAENFPALPAVEEENAVHMPQAVLREMIDGVLFAVAPEAGGLNNPTLSGLLIEVAEDSVSVVGCDGYRLGARSWKAEDRRFPSQQYVAAAAGMRELVKILKPDGQCEVVFSGNRTHICFKTEKTALVCRVIDGKYLAWRRFLKGGAPILMIADTEELTGAVERASVIVSEKYKSPLRCRFEQNRAEFTTKTTVADAADGCDLIGDGAGTEIAVSSRYLLEALKAVPEKNVKLLLESGLRPVLLAPIEGDGWCYLINPVRTDPGQR